MLIANEFSRYFVNSIAEIVSVIPFFSLENVIAVILTEFVNLNVCHCQLKKL